MPRCLTQNLGTAMLSPSTMSSSVVLSWEQKILPVSATRTPSRLQRGARLQLLLFTQRKVSMRYQWYPVNKKCWTKDPALKKDVLLKQRPFGGIFLWFARIIWCLRLSCVPWAAGSVKWLHKSVTHQWNHQRQNCSCWEKQPQNVTNSEYPKERGFLLAQVLSFKH